MSIYSYSVGDIKKVIKESTNEFKPVIGKNVESDNKKNNEKSYKDSKSRATKYDGGLKDDGNNGNKLPKKTDQNRTTLDYNPLTEPDDDYKKKVKAQIKGYTSDLEMKNKIEKGGATFDDNEHLLKHFEDARDEHVKERVEAESSGLVSRVLPKPTKNKLSESLKPKKLRFKNTVFVNESQMLNLIPNEYLKEGQVIHMVDKKDNEYIVECSLCEMSGNVVTNVKGYNNKTLLKEQSDRIYQLMGYDSKEYYKKGKMDESKNFGQMFGLIREQNKN